MPHLSLPLFGEPDGVPWQGRTALSRAASLSGAVHASEGRSTKLARLRVLWKSPRTIQGIAVLTGWPISSVCSLKARLGDELEAVGVKEQTWAQGRATARTIWRLKRDEAR